MERKKNLCAMISENLHNKVREEQQSCEISLAEYIENLLYEYYEIKERRVDMEDKKTLAIQVSHDLMDRLKQHLKKTGQTQKAFLVSVIETALDEAKGSE